MKLLNKVLPSVFCMALVAGAMFSPSAKADEWNRKTTVTFSGPVEIPGVHLAGFAILPAGTYVFKVMDSQSDRHIVQIFSKNEKIVYATILAIPNYRLKPTDKTVITFRERPAGQPQALRAWFYPGRTWGEEFVYPKATAMEMAKSSNAPVVFTTDESPAEVAEAIQPIDAPMVAQMTHAPLMAYQPTGQQVEMAQVVTPPPPAEMDMTPSVAPVTRAQKLPKTGSDTPLIALFGLLSLGAALTVRSVKQNSL